MFRPNGGADRAVDDSRFALPAGDYWVRVEKFGYVGAARRLTLTADTTLDFVLDRVRVSLVGAVREAAPCAGAIQDARVEIVTGPDAGVSASSTASGYQLKDGARVINWGSHTSRIQDGIRAGRSVDRRFSAGMELRNAARAPGQSIVSPRANPGRDEVRQGFVLQRTTSCS